MVLAGAMALNDLGKKITANSVQSLIDGKIEERIGFPSAYADLLKKGHHEGGLKRNTGDRPAGSSAWHLDQLVAAGILSADGNSYTVLGEPSDRIDVTHHTEKGDDLKKARGFVLKYASDLFARGEDVTALTVSKMMEKAAYEVGLLSSGHNGCKGSGSVDGHLRQLAAERLLVASGTGRIVYSLPNGATPESLLKGSDNE